MSRSFSAALSLSGASPPSLPTYQRSSPNLGPWGYHSDTLERGALRMAASSPLVSLAPLATGVPALNIRDGGRTLNPPTPNQQSKTNGFNDFLCVLFLWVTNRPF